MQSKYWRGQIVIVIVLVALLPLYLSTPLAYAGSNDGNIQWDELYHNASGYDPTQEFVPDESYTFRDVHPDGVIYDDTQVNLTLMTSQYELDGAYIKAYGTSTQWLAMSWYKNWTGFFHSQASHTYDLWRGTIPAHPTGTTVYYRLQLYDNSNYVYLVASGGTSNPLGQPVVSGEFDGSDWSYTVMDDDITGPQFSDIDWNVTQTDSVCARVFDNDTNSQDNDSGVYDDATGSGGQGMYLQWSTTKATVDGGGGTEVQMSLSSGDVYCSDTTINPGSQFYFRIYAYNNDYDNNLTDDREQTNSGTRSSQASGGASPDDNDIWWNEVYHDTRTASYRTPFGAVPAGQAITFHLRVAKGDLDNAALVLYNVHTGDDDDGTVDGTRWQVETAPSSSDTTYDYYEFAFTPVNSTMRTLYYKFRLTDGTDVDWYIDDYAHNSYDHEDRYENGTGMMVDDGTASQYYNNSFTITVYDQSAYTDHLDDWAQNAVIYQIMPDRFRNGDPDNEDDWPYTDVYGTAQHIHDTWNEAVDDPRDAGGAYYQHWSADFFGGDLQGVMDELDYLKAQGVTAIYFNPIFASPSNHGYDTSDYLRINPRYGDNALFQTLATEAENRGIKIILDGVFNHTGSDSRYFDRYNRWDAAGNASTTANTTGACETESSAYNGLYTFNAGTGPCTGRTDQLYDSWWGYDTLPLLNENDAVKNLVFDHDNDNTPANHVIQYWTGLGADGWRFDVADEVSHTFWQDFRARVKDDDDLDGPLYSEVWYEATPWLLGDQIDATMNYRYRKAVLGFLIDSTWTDNDNNGDQTMVALSPTEFDYVLNSIREDYPAEAWYAMMNLMDSHDTNRALFVLREQSDNLAQAIAKMQLMAALQFTYPGAPTIYYGDEVGLGAQDYGGYGTWGAGKEVGSVVQDDPYNRAPYPWPDESGTLPSALPNTGLRDTYRILALTRNNYDVLRTGDVTTLLADDTDEVYAYARTDSTGTSSPTCAIAIFNRDTSAHDVTLDLSGVSTPCPNGTVLENVLANSADYTISSGSLTVTGLPALTAAVLVPAFDNPNTTDIVASLPAVSVSATSSDASLANSASTTIDATVTDVTGQTLPTGVTVDFEIVSGDGSLGAATATTNSSGVGSVTYNAPASGQSTVVIRARITAPSGTVYSGETTVFVGYQATVLARVTFLATIGPYTEDQSGQAQVNLWARKEGRGEPVLTLARYDRNPQSGNADSGNTYYDLHLSSTTNVDALTVRFHYYTDENEASNKLYWYDSGTGWTEATGAISNTTGTGGYLEFTFTSSSTPGLGALSGGEFGAGSSNPTAVTLASFTAIPQDNAILITWETASEMANVGFNLYRSEAAAGPFTRLNDALIPPQFPGQVIGGIYEWLDTDVLPGVAYYYQLEDLDAEGVSTFHGPISVALPSAPNTLVVRGFRAWGMSGLLSFGATVLTLFGLKLVHKRRKM
ncbi:MAG: alpha amylase N-terminal ig-like domain-containing protein [Anaerolineae bacterium]|nr:alpha amylase N-terminal ig-like domain-containing protein [Anaerolineae bacterium]